MTDASGKDLLFGIFAFLFFQSEEAYFPFLVAAARDMKIVSHVTARYSHNLAVTSRESLKFVHCSSEYGK